MVNLKKQLGGEIGCSFLNWGECQDRYVPSPSKQCLLLEALVSSSPYSALDWA